MRKRENVLITFIVLCFFFLLTFLLRDSGISKGLRGIAEQLLSPVQSAALRIGSIPSNLFTNKKLEDLKEANKELASKIADFDRLKADNKALNDQFTLTNPEPSKLIPAKIVGMPSAIPGISLPDDLILNVGNSDGIKVGFAVVVKNQIIGKIARMSDHRSVVNLITNKNSSITVKNSATGALGVLKGIGAGDMILDNVVLSDFLNISDIIVTKGDESADGGGIPPDLVIGKIVSINKKASDLFQTANVKSLVDIEKLPLVFVLIP